MAKHEGTNSVSHDKEAVGKFHAHHKDPYIDGVCNKFANTVRSRVDLVPKVRGRRKDTKECDENCEVVE